MLSKSFCFLPRIGLQLERNIWEQGIDSWTAFIDAPKIKGISAKRKQYYNRQLLLAKKAMMEGDSSFFTFPSMENWRLFSWFGENAAYIDIETGTRQTNTRTNITIISISDGQNAKSFVKGVNLHKNAIKEQLSMCDIIISFNGSTFDLPVIKKHFLLEQTKPHIDLRHLCNRVGLHGGLKEIEAQLGIERKQSSIERNDDAAFLWRMWISTRYPKYLDQLLAYNQQDCLHLVPIAQHVVAKMQLQYTKFFAHANKNA